MDKIGKKTIQIQAKGAGRLSEDLVIAEQFRYAVDKRKKKITLLPLKPDEHANGNSARVWQNPRNKCGYIAMAKMLHQAGVRWEKILHQTLQVKRRGDAIEIQL